MFRFLKNELLDHHKHGNYTPQSLGGPSPPAQPRGRWHIEKQRRRRDKNTGLSEECSSNHNPISYLQRHLLQRFQLLYASSMKYLTPDVASRRKEWILII